MRIQLTVFIVIIILLILISSVMGLQYQNMSNQIDSVRQELNLQTRLLHYQTEQIKALNALAEKTANLNQHIESNKQKKVLAYRKILGYEKTCDVNIPESIAHELLSRTYRLRTLALPNTPDNTDTTNISPITTSKLTYCQTVLWVNNLLSALEQANNQFNAIRASQKLQQGNKIK